MTKKDQDNQLNITIVSLVAVVALVAVTAMVLNVGGRAAPSAASQMTLDAVSNAAGQAYVRNANPFPGQDDWSVVRGSSSNLGKEGVGGDCSGFFSYCDSSTSYCDGSTCQAKKGANAACSDSKECISNVCKDDGYGGNVCWP